MVLFTFILGKQLRKMIAISPHSVAMLKTTNTKFLLIDVSFPDQNKRPLEIEDSLDKTLINGIKSYYGNA